VLLLLAWRAAALRWRPALVVLVLAWLACVATAHIAKMTRATKPVGHDAAALAAHELSHAAAAPRTLPPAYDLADPWVVTYTDLVASFARCSDLDGRAIDADGSALPGDRCVVGDRDGQSWRVAETVVPDEPELDPLVCELAPPACPLEPTPANDGDVVATYLPPPALYLNVYGWDLATGQVPPATHVFVEDPAFIEVDVATLDGAPADWTRDVQVAVGREHLRLVSLADTGDAVRLRFEGDHLGRGLQVAFLAFGPDSALDQPRSRFALRRIAWR
jgi:hypothetical protein